MKLSYDSITLMLGKAKLIKTDLMQISLKPPRDGSWQHDRRMGSDILGRVRAQAKANSQIGLAFRRFWVILDYKMHSYYYRQYVKNLLYR